ncbi:MAG: ABC transporter ATP-binding protein [Ruminococcus sp.]|nr:ABC transporter ATP-binding protein [Ruminococcus sp.]
MAVIKTELLKKIYGKKCVLDSVSFEIEKGDIVGYLGPNGSGKTTTINIITGLLKATDGKAELLGYNVERDYSKLFGKIGILFDDNGLYERMTVKQNLDYYLDLFGENKNLDVDYRNKLFNQMNYEEISNLEVKQLSKGMKRMVGLVRALMLEPEVLILDEPFDGIDLENRSKFIKLIKEYHISKNPAVILTSHVMDDIKQLANRIIVIKKGKKLVDCSMDDFKNLAISKKYRVIFNSEKEANKFADFCMSKDMSCDVKCRDVNISISSDDDIKSLLDLSKSEFRDFYEDYQEIDEIYLNLIQSQQTEG